MTDGGVRQHEMRRIILKCVVWLTYTKIVGERRNCYSKSINLCDLSFAFPV